MTKLEWCREQAKDSPTMSQLSDEELLELIGDQYQSNVITLYHGTASDNFKPDPNYINEDTDYGSGLYLTQDINLAKEWSVSSGYNDIGYIYEFSLNIDDLKIFNFDEVNILYWLAEVISHYRVHMNDFQNKTISKLISNYSISDMKSYDIIIGNRGDAKYYAMLNNMINGSIKIEQFERAAKAGSLGIQYCIKSKKAYSLLTPNKNNPLKVTKQPWYSKFNYRIEEAEQILQQIMNNQSGTTLQEYLGGVI